MPVYKDDIFYGRYPLRTKEDKSQKLVFYKGDIITLKVVVVDEEGTPCDISNIKSLTFILFEDLWQTTPRIILTLDEGQQLQILNASKGLISVILVPVQTTLLEVREYCFYVKIDFGKGEKVILKDYLNIK